MARPQSNKKIDLDCISIKINGLPNNSENIRCKDNNENKDGFVYTSATFTEDDGESYNYNYEINKDAGIYADIIKGADPENPHLYANAIRLNDKSEGIINATKAWNGTQFDGRCTKTEEFVYNEGYSTTLGNGAADEVGINYDTGDNYDVVNFYDAHTADFSNQLIAVRNLM